QPLLLNIMNMKSRNPYHTHILMHLMKTDSNAVVDRMLFKESSRKRKCGIRCIPCRGHHIALSLHKSARAVVYCGITPASSVTFVHTVFLTCSEDLVNISLHAVGHLK